MQIQTITAGRQCKQEPKSRSLTQAMFKLHARYFDEYFFKYDIWLENHLLIRTSAVTLRNTRRLCSLNLTDLYACCFFYATNAI